MKKKIIILLLSPFTLIFIAGFTYYRWISFYTFTSGDWWYFPKESMLHFLPPSTWYSLFGLGAVDITLWRLPVINLPFYLFAVFGLGQEVAEKFVIFWPSIIVGNLSIYFLSKRIFKSKVACIISSIVFNYNTYFLATTHVLLYSAGSFALLSFLFFIKSIESRKLKYGLLVGLTLSLATYYDMRATYIIILVYIVYFFFQLITNNKPFFKYLSNTLPNIITAVFTLFLLNIFWILPLLNTRSLLGNIVLSRNLFGNTFLNLFYTLTLHHPIWTGERSIPFSTQNIYIHFWLIPFFAFLGLLLNRRNKNILFFGLVAILGILLTKQVAVPFTTIYQFLFNNLPGFGAFREASKFFLLIAIGYAILIGSLVDWLLNNFYYTKRQILSTRFIIIIILFIFLSNIIPFINGKISTIFVPRKIHKDYIVLNDYIAKQPQYFRTLWMPIFTRWGANSEYHPTLSIIDLLPVWEQFMIDIKDSKKLKTGGSALAIMQKKYSNNLVDLTSIKYLIIPLHEEESEDFFPDYGIDRNKYISSLNNIKYLKKVNLNTEQLIIYENSNFVDLFHLSYNPIKIKVNKLENIPVNYTIVSQSEYNITLNDITKPVYLNFSENYHTDWKLKPGEFNWFYAMFDDKYFLPDKYHLKNSVNFNSFYIEPEIICAVDDVCTRNINGSYNINFTIFFRAQSYLYFGLIISSITFISILVYLLYYYKYILYELLASLSNLFHKKYEK